MTTRRSISVLLLAMITVTMIFLVPHLVTPLHAFLAIVCMLAAMLGVMWMGGKGPR